MPSRFKWVTANLGLKVVSFLLALGFWFYVVGEESIEITKTVPLEVSATNEKISIVKSSTSFLEVTFQTPRHLLAVLSSSSIPAMHEINADRAGDFSFNVTTKDFTLPGPEIRITKIFPSFVTVTLDEVIVKKVPIRAELMGEPAYGYRVDETSIELDPTAVLVEGPKGILEKMDAIQTEPIQLVGRIRSFRRTVKVREEPEIRALGDGLTEVEVPVIAEFSERELKKVPVKPLGTPAPRHYVKLETDEVSFTLKGPRELLGTLELDDVLAYVEVDELKSGSHEMAVRLIMPPELSLKGEAPIVLLEVDKVKT